MRTGLELPILRGQAVARGSLPAVRGAASPVKECRQLRQSLYSHRTKSPLLDPAALLSTPDYSYLKALIGDMSSSSQLPRRREREKSPQFRYLYRLRLKKPTISRAKQVHSLADMASPLLIARAQARDPAKYQSRSLSVPRSMKPQLSVVLELPVAQLEPIQDHWRVRLREQDWAGRNL